MEGCRVGVYENGYDMIEVKVAYVVESINICRKIEVDHKL